VVSTQIASYFIPFEFFIKHSFFHLCLLEFKMEIKMYFVKSAKKDLGLPPPLKRYSLLGLNLLDRQA